MKKILIYCIVLFLLSGCSINYNLKIDEDLNIKENLYLTENNSFLEKINSDKIYLLDDLIEKYSESDTGIYILRDKINMIFEKNTSGVSIKQKYEDINNISDSELLYNMFENVEIKKSGKNMTLLMSNFFYNYLYNNFPNELKNSKIDEVVLNVELPFYVIKTNANKVKGNKYTWILTKDNSAKQMFITFDKTQTVSEHKFNIILKYILIFMAFIIGIFFMYFRIKSKKNNEI